MTETPPTAPELTPQMPVDSGPLYCANHPKVETGLRCNQCGKPICPKCAKKTPIGYRCDECISGQQKVFDTSRWYDYPMGFCTAGLLALGGSYLAAQIGWFMLFLAPIAGTIIAEVVRFLTGRRRSPRLYLVTVIGAVLGCLPITGLMLIALILPDMAFSGILGIVWQVVYAFLMTSSLYYRLSGMSFNRR